MSSNKKKICIAGAGGFGREVLCYIMDTMDKTQAIADIACFMVDDEYYTEATVMGVTVIPFSTFDASLYDVVIAIADPVVRKGIVDKLPADTTYATIIHPAAYISRQVEIGEGSIITPGAIVSLNAKIGKHAQLNHHTTLGHDCIVGDFFTTAPGVNISGNCHFGNGVYLGTNAAVRQKVKITDNVTIGMGGIVVKDILEEGVYTGVPVRKLVKR